MKTLLVLVALFFAQSVLAEDPSSSDMLTRKVYSSIRSAARPDVQQPFSMKSKAPNYGGRWAGRFILDRKYTSCQSSISSLLFRHILNQSGGRVSLNTSHDGYFTGVSRDRGRRLEFRKIESDRAGRVAVLVIYKNLSKNGRVSGVGLGVYLERYDCNLIFVANAIRQ